MYTSNLVSLFAFDLVYTEYEWAIASSTKLTLFDFYLYVPGIYGYYFYQFLKAR
jgi:hypothetical protein